MVKYYVAYGSNLNIEQMKRRCPGAAIVGTSIIEGYELLFKGSGSGFYLTIEKKAGLCVPVGIWAITKAHENALDHYEGYPSFYYKQDMELTVREWLSAKTFNLPCFVYIMDKRRKIGTPSKRYMKVCSKGYENFCFDLTFLQKAYDKSKK